MQRIEIRGCLPTAIVLALLVGLVTLALMTGTAVLVATLVLGAVAALVEGIRRRLRPRRRVPVVHVDAEGPVVEVEPLRPKSEKGPEGRE